MLASLFPLFFSWMLPSLFPLFFSWMLQVLSFEVTINGVKKLLVMTNLLTESQEHGCRSLGSAAWASSTGSLDLGQDIRIGILVH